MMSYLLQLLVYFIFFVQQFSIFGWKHLASWTITLQIWYLIWDVGNIRFISHQRFLVTKFNFMLRLSISWCYCYFFRRKLLTSFFFLFLAWILTLAVFIRNFGVFSTGDFKLVFVLYWQPFSINSFYFWALMTIILRIFLTLIISRLILLLLFFPTIFQILPGF